MRIRWLPPFFAVLTVLASAQSSAAAPAPVAETSAFEQLISQARYWENQNRYDLARENWLKLLRASPDNPAALAGLGNVEAISGHPAAAQVYLDRLRERAPDSPEIRKLENAVRQSSVGQDKLAQPRALARDGHYQQAVEAYKTVFGAEIPGGRLGLEYYQTLAGTPDGWEPARAGIEKLTKENPGEAIYQVALAQHLTYQEATRRQGVVKLTALAQDPTVAVPARQALRQGLLWLDIKPGDEALYQGYLKRFGDDPQVAARLARKRMQAAEIANAPPTPQELRGGLVREGFAALDQNQLDLAEERFQRARSEYGESADVLGGLGILRLRQQAYPEARSLLERASSSDPKRAGRWRDALSAARFWAASETAQAARKAGDDAGAVRALRQAIALDPVRAAHEPSVPVALADVLGEQDQTGEAEKIYREVLKRNPGNADALRGLIGLLVKTGRLPEALATAEQAPETARQQIGGIGALKGRILREQAVLAVRNGDDVRAEGLLKDALLLDPESPWTRVELARIYQRQHRVREADALIDGLLAASPAQGDALYVKASLLGDEQRWYEGLQLLEQLPAAARTPAMAELQKRLWLHYQIQRAGVVAQEGQPQEAARILADVERYTADMPELLAPLAMAYSDLGEDTRAVQTMRRALARNPQSDAGLKLSYAGLLFKLRQDTEFEVVLEDLLHRSDLTGQQKTDLANLRVGYRLRQADLLRQEGDLARAYAYLEPLIRAGSDDPRVMAALARLYTDSQDHEKALAIYQRVLAQNDRDIDAYMGAVGSALALKRYDEADHLLEQALALDPNNPRLYALAGRSARGRGDDGRALTLFQQALKLDAEQNGQGGAAAIDGVSPPLLQPLQPLGAPNPLPAARDYGRAAQPGAAAPLRGASLGGWPVDRRDNDPLGDRTARSPFFALVKVASRHPSTARARQVRPAFAVRVPARQFRADWRGDYALPGRYAVKGRLIRVASVSQASSAAEPVAVPEPVSDYWTQSPGIDRRTRAETRSAPVKAPVLKTAADGRAPGGAQLPPITPSTRTEFPPPRRYVPPMSQSLSRPGDSLRGEVTDEILNLQGASATPSRAVRSGVYEVQAANEGRVYPYSYAAGMAAPGYAQPVQGQRYAPTATVPATRIASSDHVSATPDFVPQRVLPDRSERRDLLKEVGELRAQRSPYAEVGLSLRSRDGVDGLDSLTDIEVPVQVAFPATDAGRFSLRAVPVSLDAGTTSGSNLPRYGAMGLALAQGIGSPDARYDNSASGTAVALGYEAGDFKADVGSSPLGFPVQTLVGGINWRPSLERMSFKIDVSRRSVTDSLLSYAGLHDPATGLTYGGVTKNGARLDMAYDLGRYGLYANGSYHVLNGEYVPRNSQVEIGGGFYARAIETRTDRVTYGLNITAFGYDKNLRYFSFGHGGYFSPQSYLAVAVPVSWEGYRRRLSYKIGGALGLQSFKEDGAALYPGEPGLQAALQTALPAYTGTLTIPAGYSSKHSTGVGFSFGGQVEYLLDSNLVLGARLALDNARDYNEASGLAYLRYMFYPQNRVAYPPNVLLPYYNFGDPRL